MDLFGALLSVLGIGLIVFGLIEGRTFGWWSTLGTPSVGPLTWTLPISPIVLAFVLGVLALALFGWVEVSRNRAGKPVLLDLSLFRIPSFRNGNIAAGIVSLGSSGCCSRCRCGCRTPWATRR